MALEVSELINVEVLQNASDAKRPEPETAAVARTFSGLAVRQLDRWVAIALELGSVAEGQTAEEALLNLQSTVEDVLEIASEEGLPTSQGIGEEELRDLILEHRRHTSVPVTMRSLSVYA
jgi:predicted RNase H-like HicB family nuclease